MSVTIKPISAHLNKGTQFVFLKKSPYVACQLGNQTFYTMPDKNGGQEPMWSETFTYFNTDPTLRVTLMDKKAIGKDQILGQGSFDMTPAYMNPGVMDRKYVEIKKQGNILARVYVEILYQGNSMNNMNNTQHNADYNSMTNMLSSDINSIAQSGIRGNNSNFNSNNNLDAGWGMNNQSQYQNQNQNPSQINPQTKPVSPSIYAGSTANQSNISNTDISQLGMSHLNNASTHSSISSTSRITTIETTRIPTVITMPTTTITTVPTLTLPPTTVYTTTSLSPRIVTTTTTPVITTTTTTYRNL